MNKQTMNNDALTEHSVLASIDIAIDSFVDFAKEIIKRKMQFNLEAAYGPGGGNPMVTIFGTKDEIVSWIHQWYEPIDESQQEFFEDMIEDEKLWKINHINDLFEQIIESLGGRDKIEVDDDELLMEISSFGVAVDEMRSYIQENIAR